MNVIGGRGGIGTSFFGLFIYLGMFCAYLLWLEFLVLVGLVILIVKSVRWLHARHVSRKRGELTAAALRDPPRPAMSKIGNTR